MGNTRKSEFDRLALENVKPLSPHYVAQHGEDQWMDRCWESLGLPEVGFFVEFGAADGVTFSNTYWLEREKKWFGLLCEPDPRHEIVSRSNCIIERCAVGPKGVVKLGQCKEPQLSGVKRKPLPYESEVRAICFFDVMSMPLSELLERHSIWRVDVLSIDVEGSEIEAWKSLDLDRWRPRLVIVELITWGLKNISREIIDTVCADGYDLVGRTHHNGIFLDAR